MSETNGDATSTEQKEQTRVLEHYDIYVKMRKRREAVAEIEGFQLSIPEQVPPTTPLYAHPIPTFDQDAQRRWLDNNPDKKNDWSRNFRRFLDAEFAIYDRTAMCSMKTESRDVVRWLTGLAEQIKEIDERSLQRNGSTTSEVQLPNIYDKDDLMRCWRFATNKMCRSCKQTYRYLDELKGVALPVWIRWNPEQVKGIVDDIMFKHGLHLEYVRSFLTASKDPLLSHQIRHVLGCIESETWRVQYYGDAQRKERECKQFAEIGRALRTNNDQECENPLQKYVGSYKCVSVVPPIGSTTFSEQLAGAASPFNDEFMIPSRLVITMAPDESHLKLCQIFFRTESISSQWLDLSRPSNSPNGIRLAFNLATLYDLVLTGTSLTMSQYYSMMSEDRMFCTEVYVREQ